MHEFSLAQGLHDQLIDLAIEHKVSKILKAEVGVGSNAGIVKDSFTFGFNVLLTQNEITQGMELVIENNSGDDLVLLRVEME